MFTSQDLQLTAFPGELTEGWLWALLRSPFCCALVFYWEVPPYAYSGAPDDSLSEASQGMSCWMLAAPDLAEFCCLLLLHCSFTYLINSLIQNQNHSDCKSSSRLSKTSFYVPRATAAWDPGLQVNSLRKSSASRRPSEQFSSNYPVLFFNLCSPSNEHAT